MRNCVSSLELPDRLSFAAAYAEAWAMNDLIDERAKKKDRANRVWKVVDNFVQDLRVHGFTIPLAGDKTALFEQVAWTHFSHLIP